MAKKLGLARVLGAGSLASVAYGEIGSSIYFALGVVALYALGATPWVLLGVGALFLLVALSYAEGTSALPETGGAATFVRRAFNDPAGFITGWALFLDYLIVIALAGLFVPHYLGTALGWDAVTDSPWDVVFGVVAILGVAGIRLVRRARMYTAAIFIAVLAFLSHLLLIGLGFAFLLSREGFGKGIDLGTAPTWHALVFSLSLAMLAFTGLETVANLAAEVREPGKALPRSLFAGIGAVVIVSFTIAAIGLSAYPPHPDPAGPDGWATDLGTTWIRAPLVGISEAFGGSLPDAAVDTIKVFLGVTGAIILVSAIATSLSGAGRLAYSLGQRAMLPRSFGRLNQRTFIAPASIVSGAVIAAALLVIADSVGRRGHLPREPLQLRRAHRLHRRAARSHPPSLQGAGSRPPVPRAGEHPHPRRAGSARAPDRRPAHVRALDRRALHARRGEDRGPDLARPRRHPLRRGAEGAPRAAARARGARGRRSGARGGGDL